MPCGESSRLSTRIHRTSPVRLNRGLLSMTMTTKKALLACGALLVCLGTLPSAAHAQAAAAPAPKTLTDADVKAAPTPSAEDKAKGDPAGTLTGTAADIPMADPKA